MAKTIKILLIGLVVVFTCCTSPRTLKDPSLIAKWAADSAGCSNFRNPEVAKKLVGDNKLMHQSKEQFLEVFGSPNETYNTPNEAVLKYYFGALCENQKQIPNSDKCWANFFFESNKLVDMGFTCE